MVQTLRHTVYWYEQHAPTHGPALKSDIDTDVVVIGGGMAGLAAAQWLAQQEIDTVVIEAEYCGAGASGVTSGIMTPDIEMNLHQLVRRFGEVDGKRLWQAAMGAVQDVRRNIESLQIECDLIDADTLFVGTGSAAAREVGREHHTRQQAGVASTYYSRWRLPKVLNGIGFGPGVRYGPTFGFNALAYLQNLRDLLRDEAVRIYEYSPALKVAPGRVLTPRGSVRAKHVIACVDRFAEQAGIAADQTYHQQNFVVVSEPLDTWMLEQTFPAGPMLVADSHLLDHYMRPTPDGRLIVGGSMDRAAYRRELSDPAQASSYLMQWFRSRFPHLAHVDFTHGWAGQFGVSRDLLPIAGRLDGKGAREAGMYAGMCGGGMAWSKLAGEVAARTAIEGATEFEPFFAPGRAYTPLQPLERAMSKSRAFELSNRFARDWMHGRASDVADQQEQVRKGTKWTLTGAAVATGLALVGGLAWALSGRDEKQQEDARPLQVEGRRVDCLPSRSERKREASEEDVKR
ncbi:MAG: FAD-binding oxidoreductase [Phycisphaeraceae bacterium]